MKLVIEKQTLRFRKEYFSYYHHAYYCEDSKEYISDNELDTINITQVYNQYLVKYNIPFPEEIKEIRNKYDLPVSKMSLVLGFGINTYRQYESGEIPILSNAKLIHIAKDPIAFRKMVYESTEVFNELEKKELLEKIDFLILKESKDNFKYVEKYMLGETLPDIYTGYKSPNLEKFAQMVIFFSERLNPLKTVLNKLLFYSDFFNYKKNAFAISGLRYRAIDYGPVPNNFQTIFEHLQKCGYINIIGEYMGSNYVAERFVPVIGRTFDNTMFTEQELQTLEHVATQFKDISRAVDIKEKSHDELAWIENNESKSLISYDYGFKLINV